MAFIDMYFYLYKYSIKYANTYYIKNNIIKNNIIKNITSF